MFAVAIKNTPLFSEKGLEMVLLPGSVLTILSEEGNRLVVTTEEYPSVKQLYIDRRFVNITKEPCPPRKKEMPTPKQMLEKLDHFPRLPYVWGGNVPEGVPELLEYNPPQKWLTPAEFLQWQLKGVDCSGLVYAITNGFTPRNTVDIYNTYPEVSSLKPLDLIVWLGHVMIVLSQDSLIESRGQDGVIVSNLNDRLKQVEGKNPKFVRFI